MMELVDYNEIYTGSDKKAAKAVKATRRRGTKKKTETQAAETVETPAEENKAE